MSKGSLLSGLAFSNTKTTACHSISYPITAFFNVPHGLACALTLPEFLEFNEEAIKEKAKNLAEAYSCNNLKEAAEKVRNLMKNLEIPTTLTEVGINKKDIPIIIENGFTPDRVKYNPKLVTKEDLKFILEKIL